MVGEVDKAESSRAAPLVLHHSHAERPPWKHEDDQSVERSCDKQDALTKSCEDLLQLLIVAVFSKVFDVDVGELQSLAAQLLLSLLTGFKVSHKTAEERKKTQRCQQQRGTNRECSDQTFCICYQVAACVCVCVQVSDLHFSVIEQHPVHGFDGSIRCLFSLKVNKAVAFGSSFVTNHLQKAGLCKLEPVSSRRHQQRPINESCFKGFFHLARQNVPKGREGVVQSLVVDRLVHVLDKNVSNARLPQPWVTLGPHYSDGSSLNHVVVHGIQRALR